MNWKYVIEAYGFIIRGLGLMSGSDFADHIAKVYSVENPRNELAVKCVREQIDKIEIANGGGIWVRLNDKYYASCIASSQQ